MPEKSFPRGSDLLHDPVCLTASSCGLSSVFTPSPLSVNSGQAQAACRPNRRRVPGVEAGYPRQNEREPTLCCDLLTKRLRCFARRYTSLRAGEK